MVNSIQMRMWINHNVRMVSNIDSLDIAAQPALGVSLEHIGSFAQDLPDDHI